MKVSHAGPLRWLHPGQLGVLRQVAHWEGGGQAVELPQVGPGAGGDQPDEPLQSLPEQLTARYLDL